MQREITEKRQAKALGCEAGSEAGQWRGRASGGTKGPALLGSLGNPDINSSTKGNFINRLWSPNQLGVPREEWGDFALGLEVSFCKLRDKRLSLSSNTSDLRDV